MLCLLKEKIMTHHTHVTISLNALLGILLIMVCLFNITINFQIFSPILFGTIFGSLLPDIDEPESWIGKRTPLISHLFNVLFGHRGATHFLVFPLPIIASLYFITDTVVCLFVFGIIIGYISHFLGDLSADEGIKNFLFPFGKREKRYVLLPRKFRFKTNSFAEHVLSSVLGVLLLLECYLIYKNGGIIV